MRIGLYLPNWVGDAVMATPAIEQLRRAHPEATLVGIARPVVEQTLRGLPVLDEILVVPKSNSFLGLITSFERDAKLLRSQSLDAVVLMTNSFRTALVCRMAGIRQRIGFDRDRRGWLLTDKLDAAHRKTPHSVVDDYLALVEPLGADTHRLPLQLTVDQSDQEYWHLLCRELGIGSDYIVFNTGGAFGPAKHWGDEKFASLAWLMYQQTRKSIVVICGPAEAINARQIVELVETKHPEVPIYSLADIEMSLGISKAVVADCSVMVSTDSGPRHFAAAFNKPIVSIYGPTHQAWSENGHTRDIPVQIEVDCGPCQKRDCPYGHHRCMSELKPETVLLAAQKLEHKTKAA